MDLVISADLAHFVEMEKEDEIGIVWSSHAPAEIGRFVFDMIGDPKMRVYIAGPMTGYKSWNFPAFDECRDWLHRHGYEVISPADLDRQVGVNERTRALPKGFKHLAYARDSSSIGLVDAVVILPGFETSDGSTFEIAGARFLGLTLYRWTGNGLEEIDVEFQLRAVSLSDSSESSRD
jgi:hypothetical protein